MADNNTVARPYAQAIFEIANETSELAGWSETLAIAGRLLEATGPREGREDQYG